MENKRRKPFLLGAVSVAPLLALVFYWPAFASGVVPNLVKLESELGKDVEISTDKLTGKLNFLAKKGKRTPLWKVKGKNKENKTISWDFLREFGGYFGIENPDRDLSLLKETKDSLGMNHLKYNQKVNGVPVLGGQLIVHLKDKQAVTAVNGSIKPILDLDTNPRINREEAVEQAKKFWINSLKSDSKQIGDPKLYVYNKQPLKKDADPTNYLVWEINLFSTTPYQHELYYIDAITGSLIDHHNVIKKAVDRRVYNCNAWDYYGDCVLVDTDFGVDHGRSEGVVARGIADIDNLYDYTGSVHDYYSSTFTRDGANDSGGLGDGSANPYAKTDSYGKIDSDPYRGYYCPDNAYFEDNSFYGGATINFCEGSGTKDVVGHEYGHGMSYYSILDGYGNPSGLTYAYESGAIEEANADVFGEALENYIDGSGDWLLGEDIASGPFRDLANPTSLGNPDRFNSTYFYCGGGDNGGVHINSTVIGHAAYLMATGGTYNGCVIGAIGRTKEEAIFYRAINQYLTVNSDFNDAYNALNAACSDLYGVGSGDCGNVKKALRSVEMDQGGTCSGWPAVAPECDFTRAPTISSVSSDTKSGNYGEGDVIDIDIYFSELVTSTGSVTIAFNTGGSCTFTINGQGMGTCNYTVSFQDSAYAYLDVTSITGTINDQDGNAMVNFTPSSNLSQNRLIYFDVTAPVVSGVERGGIYRNEVIPTFNEGTATLNGIEFISGQAISEDGDYTLIVTDNAGNITTITFRIEKVTTSVSILNYKKKKATSRMVLTFYNLNLPGRLKKKSFRVRFNGRRANIAGIRNTANGLVINMRFKYNKWPRGQYDMVMGYGYKSGRTTIRGGASKNNLFSIN